MYWQDRLDSLSESNINFGVESLKILGNVLDILHHPKSKIITIAGTNGKGSTLYAIEALLCAKGLRVASYTSPHIHNFYERIKVAQKEINDQQLNESFLAVSQVADKHQINLSYFELSTLAALWYFKRCAPDVILLEVGLGGRLDATNACDADIAIITSIGLDHTQLLGHSLQEIATEKVQIARRGKPCILGQRDMRPLLHDALQEIGAFMVECVDQYQSINAFLPSHIAIAHQVCKLLHITISPEEIATCLSKITMAGRWQEVRYKNRTIIVDGAHNPDACDILVERIDRHSLRHKVYCVFSMMRDKDIQSCMRILERVVDHWIFCDLPYDRASSAQDFTKYTNKHYNLASNIKEGISMALSLAIDQDTVVVTGSYYALGDIQ